MTEILSGDLKEGDEVVAGVSATPTIQAKSSNAGSPFVPKPPARRKNNSNAKK